MRYICVKPFFLDPKDGNWPVTGNEFLAVRLNSIWDSSEQNSSKEELCLINSETKRSLEVDNDVLEYFFRPLSTAKGTQF